MDIESLTCPDCGTYPSNFISIDCYDKNIGHFMAYKCRDCGDYWEDLPDISILAVNDEEDSA